MNNIAVIIVGIGQWDKYTKPLIDSIGEDADIVVIDNASEPPYPEGIRTERICYSAAINEAVKHTDADWLLSMNNDVICTGEFTKIISGLKPDAIYARQIIEEKGVVWFGNWLVLIPRAVWDKVGEFDEAFEMCGFEDADYSMRAKALGIDTKPIDLPFHHYWGKTRWGLEGYPKIREKNQKYLEEKHGILLGNGVRVTHG